MKRLYKLLPAWLLRIYYRRAIRATTRSVNDLRRRIDLGDKIIREGWYYRSLEQMKLATDEGLPGARKMYRKLKRNPHLARP